MENDRLLRIAAISDIHWGNPDTRYPNGEELEREFAQADEAGADMLFLLGDITDRSLPGGGYAVGTLARESFRRSIYVIGGNHDSEETLDELRDAEVHVLDRESTIETIHGLQVGIYGQNGSMPFAEREAIRTWSWKDQEPVFHAYTAEHYHPGIVEALDTLVQQGVDIALVLSHVGLYAQQRSQYGAALSEMTPLSADYIDGLTIPRVVFSGHNHSFSDHKHGCDDPITVSENGTILGNFAAPNARRTERPVVTLFDIHVHKSGVVSATLLPTLSPVNVS